MLGKISDIITPGGYWNYQRIPSRASPGQSHHIWGDKSPYWRIGNSRLDCSDKVRLPSRLVPRRSETRSGEVRFGTLNVCGDMYDKIDDVCELMKYKQLDILCGNETKRKDSDGAMKRGSIDTYWSGVDKSQQGYRDVGFILSESLSECVNGYERVNSRLP
ncbi:hypothetical protein EVAR_40395_1 [Eumeta japonica]|uniref:Craniofacial development protein 2 n=1 Tax=Eumeta variegata TaxID=151549 RepID=A0A4C1WAA8_EUMVA|nr:hypothetical protein EVAR_40395_1 [Eumeta japonica]